MASESVATAVLGQLLYVSALKEGVPVTEVSRIVTAARLRNAADGITGLLVFDGDAFCQYVEGPPAAVEALLGRLWRDKRHTELDILVDGTFAGERRFSGWRLGYVDSFEHDEIGTLRSLRDGDALVYFDHLVPRLDVET